MYRDTSMPRQIFCPIAHPAFWGAMPFRFAVSACASSIKPARRQAPCSQQVLLYDPRLRSTALRQTVTEASLVILCFYASMSYAALLSGSLRFWNPAGLPSWNCAILSRSVFLREFEHSDTL